MRSSQEFLHWLEIGAGARWVRRGAIFLGLISLSLIVAWKQFHGPQSETTLLQADVGRQLAHGDGFTTLVNYPQTAAVLAARGRRFDPARPYPEIHHAPLYSIVIAGALLVLPDDMLFGRPPAPPNGFAADYVLLWLNVILLWLAAVLTYVVGKKIFSARVGVVASLALLFSMPVWQQTVTVNGLPLPMVLALAAFWLLAEIEQQAAVSERTPHIRLGVLGVAGGLLFLAEYSAGAMVLVFLGYAAWRFRGRARWVAPGCVAAGFILIAAPWCVRNLALTGSPVGLAWQNVALKAGDSTAEPATVRATFSAAAPELSLAKLGNKGLTALQETLRTRLWAGGGLLLTAFFVAGFLYRFRAVAADRLRWVFTAVLAVAVTAQAFLGSGESEWLPTAWLAPLLIIFGTAFFFVLVESNSTLSAWPRAAAAALLLVQAVPLVHDALEPRRLHFFYPPYFPSVFMALRAELAARHALDHYGAMTDVPAGTAWYGRLRVWAQPAQLHDFYVIGAEQPVGLLLLTPHTLDRPFFGELTRGAAAGQGGRLGEWAQVYTGLVTGKFPSAFPLLVPHKIDENMIVLLNPALPREK